MTLRITALFTVVGIDHSGFSSDPVVGAGRESQVRDGSTQQLLHRASPRQYLRICPVRTAPFA
jgi:hypothetical protein